MTAIPDNEIWRTFIHQYRNMPELWKVKSDAYKNKYMRDEGWKKLFIVFKQIERKGTIESMKKRLGNMRTCYRRQLNKKLKSERAGKEYVPSLWYFDEFEFLQNETEFPNMESDSLVEVVPANECSNSPLFDLNIDEDNNYYSDGTDYEVESITGNISIKRKKSNDDSNDDFLTANHEKDEAAIFAACWAVSYRKLSEDQKIFAKKAIDDILILGQLKQLDLNNVRYLFSNVMDAGEKND